MSIYRGAALTQLAPDALLPALCRLCAHTYSPLFQRGADLSAGGALLILSITRLNPLSPGVLWSRCE